MTVIAFRSRRELIIRKNSSRFIASLKNIDSVALERLVFFVGLGWSYADTYVEPVNAENIFLVKEELDKRKRICS